MDGQLPRVLDSQRGRMDQQAEILGLGNSSGSFNQQHHSIVDPKATATATATATASSSSSSSTSTSKQQQQQQQQSQSQFRPMTTDFNDSSPLFSELDDQNRMLINELEFLFNQNSQQQQPRAENESIYSNDQQRNSVQAQGPELGSIIGSTNLSNDRSAGIRIEDGFEFLFGKQLSVDHTSRRDERVMDVLESFDENQRLESIDRSIESSLDSNLVYSQRIRETLGAVLKSLSRAEELLTLSNHCVKDLQSQRSLQRQQLSKSSNNNTNQKLTLSYRNDENVGKNGRVLRNEDSNQDTRDDQMLNGSNGDEPMMICIENNQIVSLPWLKHKFDYELPINEDFVKRDNYNLILHQQAWQSTEKRKLEEEIKKQKNTLQNRSNISTSSNSSNNCSVDSSLIDWQKV
ncbi:hypothetical protein BY996DRAFT_7253399, partial [Phakopsora pachyrhizi]